MMHTKIHSLMREVECISDVKVCGRVLAIRGMLIEASGLDKLTGIGARCQIEGGVRAEVIGVQGSVTYLMPFGDIGGIGSGALIRVISGDQSIYPSASWLGRVINAFGEPLDGKGSLAKGDVAYPLYAAAPPAQSRNRVQGKLNVGIRAINTFLTCCKGQRLGIFSGSGVGKSMMMAMMTKFADTDVKIIGLIGERGREVQEFIEDYLGEEGLSKAIVVVATSDESALMKKQATYLTLALSEYFRDTGLDVLYMLDNLTRFAMAQREIGLAVGEPPTTKGYTPSVFALLPKLLERTGPGVGNQGAITAFFSVLVEGDDMNEPISDAVRGILDGHIVLDRNIAGRGIFPAIDILHSISRTMPRCNNDQENDLVNKAKKLLLVYRDMEDMIRIGAYKRGSDPEVEEAIKYYGGLCNFISQKYDESDNLISSYEKLSNVLGISRNN